MTIRSFDGATPQFPASAYIDELAVLIGNVTLGEDVSIWPMVVVRGDVNSIRIDARSNIQDGSVLHVNHAGEYSPEGSPLHIGSSVTVGHRVMLHGCTIADMCLIGMGSTVMDYSIIESHTIIGAGSLVPPGKTLQSGYLWKGSPVKRARALSEAEIAQIEYSADHYALLKDRYRSL